jgi:P-type E1-E2 ATPase
VLDVNGTLTQDGVLLDGVTERLGQIRESLSVHLLSADTFGRLDQITEQLGVQARRLRAGEPEPAQKAEYVRALGLASVVAIGNGANDAEMLSEAAIGVAIIGPEGVAIEAIRAADVVVGSITTALDLLLFPKRLVATLRR